MYTSKIPYSGAHCTPIVEAFLFAAEAGEGGLILGVDGSGTTASAAEVVASTAAITATLTTASTTSAASAAAASTRALRFNVARVEVERLLDLALTLTLLLAVAARNELLVLVLLESLGIGPFLVELATLVGPTDLEATLEGEFLLGLLGEVVDVRDALVLGFSWLLAGAILSEGFLPLGSSNSLASLLVL